MQSKNILVRKAAIQDADLLAIFNQNIAKETENITLIPDTIQAGVRRLIEDEGRGFYIVAEVDGQVVASLMVTKEWSDWRNGEFWWIQSVYVVKEWRRKGLYTLLYKKVKELSIAAGNVCGYRLYVEHENIAAQKTYHKNGMHPTHYQIYEELIPGLEFSANPDGSDDN